MKYSTKDYLRLYWDDMKKTARHSMELGRGPCAMSDDLDDSNGAFTIVFAVFFMIIAVSIYKLASGVPAIVGIGFSVVGGMIGGFAASIVFFIAVWLFIKALLWCESAEKRIEALDSKNEAAKIDR